MTTIIDRDTNNWVLRLVLVSAILIAIFEGFEGIPFLVRALGNLFVLGAIFFLFDVTGGRNFKIYYWIVFFIWSVVLIQTAIGFMAVSVEFNKAFSIAIIFVYALEFLSVPLFCQSMRYMCLEAGNLKLGLDWKKSAIFSATFYALPFLGFLGVFIGRSLGQDVGLVYGANDPNSIFAEPLKILIRLSLFIPLAVVIYRIYNMGNILFMNSATTKTEDVGNPNESLQSQ